MKTFAVVALLGCLAFAAQAQTDADILNFALQLEYLEGEFYSCASTGSGLPANLRGGGPASIGCQKATLGSAVGDLAAELAANEMTHVQLLRSALGSAATPMPLINIGSAFAAAANAAVGMTLSPPFTPYANDLFFLHGAFIFEDVGVTAYQGAIPLIKNASYTPVAAGIEAVEGMHAGAIRALLYNNANLETPYNVTVADLTHAIAELRDTVGGVTTNDVGIVNTAGTAAALFPVDSNALAYARTPPQVLAITYLGSANGTGGGFYPNGVNGYFKTSTAAGPAMAPTMG